MRAAVLLLLISFSLIGRAQEPWPVRKGGGRVGTGFSYLGYGSILGADGSSITLHRKVNQVNVDISGRYGLTDRLTFMGSVPMTWAGTGSAIQAAPYFPDTLAAAEVFGLANIMLGINYNLVNKSFGLSFFLNGEANVPTTDSVTALRSGPSTFVIHPGLRLGYRKGMIESWVEGGYRIRFKGYTSDLDLRYVLDICWNKKTHIAFLIGGRARVTKLDPATNQTMDDTLGRTYERALHTGLFANGAQYAEFGMRFEQRFKGLGINARIMARYGSRVAIGPEFGLGLMYDW